MAARSHTRHDTRPHATHARINALSLRVKWERMNPRYMYRTHLVHTRRKRTVPVALLRTVGRTRGDKDLTSFLISLTLFTRRQAHTAAKHTHAVHVHVRAYMLHAVMHLVMHMYHTLTHAHEYIVRRPIVTVHLVGTYGEISQQ
jgi:hypothetical protein